MSTTGFQRELDLAPTATIDKVALNNKVVLMRAIVKRSKLHLINGLVKRVHKLRDKKGSDAQKKQNKSKADRLLEDIKIIKVLKPDYVSKYALGTTVKFEELAAKTSTSAEMRALARLAAHKFIMQEVDKFRHEHEDWKDLAAYLMTKHTSREFKKKKTKEKMKKVEANVIASENLVQKYLGEKLDGRTDLDDEDDDVNNKEEADVNDDDGIVNDDESDVNDDGADDSSEESEEMDERTGEYADVENKINENKKSLKKKDMNFSKMMVSESTKKRSDGFIGSEDSDKEREDLEANNSDEYDDDDDDDDNDIGNDGSDDDYEKEYESGDDKDDDETIEKVKDNVQFSEKLKEKIGTEDTRKSKNKHKNNIRNKSTNNVPKKNVPLEKVEGEMIVKKLNLAKDFVEEDIPKILLSDNEDKLVKNKKKRKDLFFDTGVDYDSGNQDREENEVNNHGDLDRGENVGVENDERENYERSIQPTMTAFTTCFVGSLKSSDMMGCDDSQYRSNEDWKRMRHEMKEQKFGSFRGRGQAPTFRGRGPTSNFGSYRGRGFSDGPRGRGFSDGPRGRGFSDGPRGRGFSGGPRGRGHAGRSRGFDGFRGRGGFEASDHTRRGPETKKSDSNTSGGLHPSWEASKKRKQEQKAVLQAFEGKKIKFDD